ncbi:hypothetical protein [Paenibacillus aquistagni]|uniref:hypothetical protein n=1 Tax=Paenibacillus aquistagni TaxID=1852522 RepID=UPI001FD30C1E|nr:hypothetical protein [Paenibacillus aquistagni]
MCISHSRLRTFWSSYGRLRCPFLHVGHPDCGLKTRNECKTIKALRHMVLAAKQVRSKVVEPNETASL